MRFYQLNHMGKFDMDFFCFAEGTPNGFADKGLVLELGGKSLVGLYPDDPYEVKMKLREDWEKHIKKGDFISHTIEYVMVFQEAVDIISEYNVPNVEYWPFTLLNHKERVHSTNYRFVVPVDQFDAVNEQASDIDRDDDDGMVLGVDLLVLDKNKVSNAPDMFRVNDLGVMVFSEPLAKRLETECTNFVFEPLEIA